MTGIRPMRMTTNRLGSAFAGAVLGLILVAPARGFSADGGPITLESLLLEMVDRDALARWPEPSYTCRQASSYDRRSLAPGQPGWFANEDTGQYLRVETNAARLESVMLDAEGPGCIVRWWTGSIAGEIGPPGLVRVYLDGSATPVIE